MSDVQIVQPNLDQSAMVVADLQLNNIELGPLPGTPLYMIVNEIANIGIYATADSDLLGPEAALQFVSTIINNDETIQALIQEAVEEFSKIALINIKTAQQEALPIIREVVEHIEKAYREQIEGVSLNIEVVSTADQAIWSSGKLETFLPDSDADLHSVSDMSPSYFIPAPTQILDLLKTGAPSFDAEIDSWLQSIPNSTTVIAHVWSNVFVAREPRSLDQLIVNGFDHNESLMALLFARHLLNMDRTDMVELADGVSLPVLLTALKQAEDFAAVNIRTLFVRKERARALGQMIIAAPKASEIRGARQNELDTALQILVDGDLYTAFLAQGGTPDVVIGAVIKDGIVNLELLMSRMEIYRRAARQAAAIVAETAESQRLSVARSTIRRSLYQYLEAQYDDRSAYRSLLVEVEPVVEAKLTVLTSGCIEDLYAVVTDIVCTILFKDTDVQLIIDNINRLGRSNEGADVRELANQATFDYLAKFFACQVVALQQPN